MDDFFTRAILAGIGVAIVSGPLGCCILWRRLAFYGDTLGHAGLLGITLSFALKTDITLSVFLITVIVAIILSLLQFKIRLPMDVLLGLMAHSALALGMISLSIMSWIRVDLIGFLFGDILAVSKKDIIIIWLGGIFILILLTFIWKSLFASTVNFEVAQAEGMRPKLINFIFMLMMAAVIAISMKIVGVLLITSMLIFPAAIARRFSISPEHMALLAAIFGVMIVFGGLLGSLQWDTPAGPSIVVAASSFFFITILFSFFLKIIKNTFLLK